MSKVQRIRTKLLKKHSKDCRAITCVADGRWDSPWAPFTGNAFYADTLCRIRSDRFRGSHRWLTVGCNDACCPALIAVMESDLTFHLPIGA